MKIIDILIKMANGEELPKKIKLKGTIYEYDKEEIDYIDKSGENPNYWGYLSNYLKNLGFEHLTDEVEIMEDNNNTFENLTKDSAKNIIQNMFEDLTPEQFEEIKKQAMENVKLNNMTAKEMFEKLGYELIETNSAGIKLTTIQYYNYETTSSIIFWSSININVDLQNYEHLTAKHIQAINKQVEELGWLGDKK